MCYGPSKAFVVNKQAKSPKVATWVWSLYLQTYKPVVVADVHIIKKVYDCPYGLCSYL